MDKPTKPKRKRSTRTTFPPIVCRLLARDLKARANAQRPLTDEELAERSGFRLDQIKAFSWLCSWDHVPVQIMEQFSKACGINFTDYNAMQRHHRFINRMEGGWLTGKHYLRRDHEWETKWRPMIETYITFVQAQWQDSKK